MNIPKSIKIGGHTIKIEQKKLDSDCGMYDTKKATITIDEDMPQTLKESTLIHEMFHVMNSTMGDSTFGHSLQDSLAEQLYQVLKDNKMLK